MSSHALFVEAVQRAADLPALLRDHAREVVGLEEHRFDESYIEFLDTQIRLSPRGPAWTERLVRRRAALLPYCDVTLLYGRVRVGDADFTVEIDPRTRAVVHWEEYDRSPQKAGADGASRTSVREDLDRLFPGYRSPERAAEWEAAKARLQLRSTVRGIVVARYPFGVFVDIDARFPALILVVKLKGADRRPYTDIERYPAVGSVVEGRIYVFGDVLRQIGLTQLDREAMLGEA